MVRHLDRRGTRTVIGKQVNKSTGREMDRQVGTRTGKRESGEVGR